MTAKQIKELAARYAKFVEWSEEDKCFIGRCPELMLGGVHGNDEAKVYAELCAAVEEMIEVIHAEGQEMPHPLGKKAFSGKVIEWARQAGLLTAPSPVLDLPRQHYGFCF